MPHPLLRPRFHDLVVLLDRNVDGEKATEHDDRPPAKRQPGNEEEERSDIEQPAFSKQREASILRGVNARCHTEQNYEPQKAYVLRSCETPLALRDRRVAVSNNSETR